MILKINIFCQNSFELTGNQGLSSELSIMNSFEMNPSSFYLLKDWGLKLAYGGEFSGELNSSIYLLSLSKKISNHFFLLRYTPGYQKDFLFSTGESIVFEDSSLHTLNSRFSYKEIMGLGYSYKFSDQLNAGFSLRYFTQEFTTEYITPVFGDQVDLLIESETGKSNFWKGDIGFNYQPVNEVLLSASSLNLFILGESDIASENEPYVIRKDKAAQFGFSYTPQDELEFNIIYETTNSFQTGINTFFETGIGTIGTGITVFHDEHQSPFIAGIIPSISYSNNFFGITFSGVNYFSERLNKESFSEFRENGLSNIINNRYSFDKVVLTLSFTLNTVKNQSVELIDVEVINEIYPTFTELYSDLPFATGKVINLTENPLIVKPYSRIEGINNNNIQSPEIYLAGKDTAEVKFYALIPEKLNKVRTEISYADFYVSVSGEEPEDQFQKAVLLNSSNSWDGNVSNLKYFIKKDPSFSLNFTRKIFSRYKKELDTLANNLQEFYKMKIIFNEAVKELVYTSDPRASAEYVQFPLETIKLKGGDCDDLSVLFSSLYESAGIETALVDYKTNGEIRHVNILVNTNLDPEDAKLITENDSRFFLRKNDAGKDKVWIPVEITDLNGFNKAWNSGVEKFNKEALQKLGIATGKVKIIDIN
jgi:hypothetical protein